MSTQPERNAKVVVTLVNGGEKEFSLTEEMEIDTDPVDGYTMISDETVGEVHFFATPHVVSISVTGVARA